jgi:hypothetical protein
LFPLVVDLSFTILSYLASKRRIIGNVNKLVVCWNLEVENVRLCKTWHVHTHSLSKWLPINSIEKYKKKIVNGIEKINKKPF